MSRFIDTNIFIYAATGHPQFGETARRILARIEAGEQATTTTLVLCEVAWVLESMGRQADILSTLEKILSYRTLTVEGIGADDLLLGARNATMYGIDFNDGVNVAVMERLGINQVYTNDRRHLGRVATLQLLFE